MALANPPATPPASSSSLSGLTRTLSHPPQTDFDVVAHYNNSIKSNPSLPLPIAAIEALVALLTHTPLTTVSETLALIDAQCLILRQSAPNPIPISAGTDLFQRYLVASFQQRSAVSSLQTDFSTLRAKLVATSKLFTSKAKNAGQQVAVNFLPFVVDDGLFSAVQRQSSVLVLSCHAVFSNGALLTPLGSYMLALTAREAGIPVYCTVESFNFVRSYPLSSDGAELKRLGVKQDVLQLRGRGFPCAKQDKNSEKQGEAKTLTQEDDNMVEIVPAALITALVTENGIMAPSSVSEELIKLWF
ncbi:hypothetical protein DV736_g5179, partial [Chaetothyriales sp. CBS 134916]